MDGEPDNVLVRSLRQEDAPRLVRMDQAITGRNRSAWYEGKLKRALEGSDLRISLGAEVDGCLVGAVLGSLHYGEFGLPEPIAVLDTILVDPGHARHGVGTALLDQFVKNLCALGIERLRTEVAWDEHGLNRFLGRHGFAPAPRLVLERSLGGDSPGGSPPSRPSTGLDRRSE
ncbi:MAG: GNAT family N-acetyltransferase [Acidobacteriota bacterium]|nr:GNAT family N-acetyltransferase [Acidobacteriota bacterium]